MSLRDAAVAARLKAQQEAAGQSEKETGQRQEPDTSAAGAAPTIAGKWMMATTKVSTGSMPSGM
eukprot:684166-Prymnesium_polylepis.2